MQDGTEILDSRTRRHFDRRTIGWTASPPQRLSNLMWRTLSPGRRIAITDNGDQVFTAPG